MLQALAASQTSGRVDLAAIARFMGRGSIAALLIVLALPMAVPIPLPGISVIFGIPLIVVSGQLLLGRRDAWLPRALARRSLATADLALVVGRVLPRLRALERLVKPRLEWLTGDWAMLPVGAVCLLLAIVITLPIPLGHVLPGTAIVVLALGLLERDGVVVGLGLLLSLVAMAVIALASAGLVAVLRPWFSL
ncbi:MAG TPA: exopolysaccharide biosynthesis protein [Stellaceae bacterium]|nr:exopolysaccharide biosynthesis protein [Stellaceae bacterium]